VIAISSSIRVKKECARRIAGGRKSRNVVN
jgi:hypothetical protein